jgi:lipopolysaccharide biosynthesis glycosyltransferase
MKTTLQIVVTTDDHFVIMLAALIKSAESFIDPSTQLVFNIVNDQVSDLNKAKLEESINPTISQLNWIDMDGLVPQGMQLPLDFTSYPPNIYMRFFIPYFMDASIETVLYMDVDMIVQANLAELFALDMSQHIIAAVTDPRVKTFDNAWGGVKNYKALGMSGKMPYFNSGLLLINLKAWRQQSITAQLIQCIKANVSYANYPDQYGLNVVLANQWLPLASKWNHFATMPYLEMPSVIHFVQRKPIYQSYVGEKWFQQQFFHYLELTQWHDFQPISEFKRIWQKMGIVAQKIKNRFV